MKYKEWLSVWLENYIKPSAKQRTYDTYFQMIEKRIIPKIGDCELDDLTPIVLQSFVTELLNNGNTKTNQGLAVSTVNLIITIIQNSLKTAVMLGKTKEYIANKIKRPIYDYKHVDFFIDAIGLKINAKDILDKKNLIDWKNSDITMKGWSLLEFQDFLYFTFGRPKKVILEEKNDKAWEKQVYN